VFLQVQVYLHQAAVKVQVPVFHHQAEVKKVVNLQAQV
jgi:hypothetical protein